MILTCPNCQTSFNVPDGAIPPEGRKVKCANCAHRWHAMPTPNQPAPQQAPQPATRPAPQQAKAPHPNKPQMPQPLQQQTAPPPNTADTAPVEEEPFEEDASIAAQRQVLRKQLSDGGIEDASGGDAASQSARPAETAIAEDDLADDDLSDDFSGGGFDLDDGESDLIDETEGPDDENGEEDFDDPFGGDAPSEDFMARIKGAATSAGLDEADLKPREEEPKKGFRSKLKIPGLGKGLGPLKKVRVFKDDRKPMIGWVAFLGFWVAAFFGFLSEEERIREAWPASELVYDWIDSFSLEEAYKEGVDEDAPSIVDEKETTEALITETEFDQSGDRTYLVVRGFVRNTGKVAARVPQVRLILFTVADDGTRTVFDEHIFQPKEGIMTRATHVPFEERISNFPSGGFSASVETLSPEEAAASGLEVSPAEKSEQSPEGG